VIQLNKYNDRDSYSDC